MIYFVRHGETEYNREKRSQGQSDVTLNETGKQQAKECAKWFKGKKFDVFFCSILMRAKQSADEINKYLNMEIKYDPRLMEFCSGDIQGIICTPEQKEEYFKDPHKYHGENVEDVVLRVTSFLKDIQKYKGEEVLIVAHGGSFAVMKMLIDKAPLAEWEKYRLMQNNMKNSSIHKIDF